MTKTKILYYIFPFHIDMLEKTIFQLKRSSNYSNLKEYLSIEVVLNMSDKNLDWSNCSIPKQYFIDKFKYIEKYCDFFNNVNFEINDDLLSSGEQFRRAHASNNGKYNIISLDPDIHFPPQIFQVLENSIKVIEQEKTSTYIISFQIPKFWDESWNILSHPDYLNSNIKVEDIDVFELEKKLDVNNIEILKNYNHKFAGGWFTFYSADMSKFLSIPDNIGTFVHNDLFYQEKIKILNQKGYDIPQYIIQNCMVFEDRKYYHKNEFIHKNYLPYQKQRPHMGGDSEDILKNIQKELLKLSNS